VSIVDDHIVGESYRGGARRAVCADLVSIVDDVCVAIGDAGNLNAVQLVSDGIICVCVCIYI